MIKLKLFQSHPNKVIHKNPSVLGFTLLEMVIVLLILGLLSSFLTPLVTRLEQEARNNTRIQLDTIQQVLYGFVLKEHRLPCPDCATESAGCVGLADGQKEDGQEDVLADSTCATRKGNLPWATLGVRGVDAWENEFTYFVSRLFADNIDGAAMAGCTVIPSVGVSFSLCSNGSGTVEDGEGNLTANNIPAIVLSHGENGSEDEADLSADEIENTDNDGRFIERGYSQSEDEGFDDLLIWISPHTLRSMSVNAGILP